MTLIFKKISNVFKREKKPDPYQEGRYYMKKLLDFAPEQVAYAVALKVDRDPSKPFDKGVLDYIEEYKQLQRGVKR